MITFLTAEIAENAEHFLSAPSTRSAVKFPALIHAVLCQDVDHIVLSKYADYADFINLIVSMFSADLPQPD